MPRMMRRVSRRPQAHLHFYEHGLLHWRVLKAASTSVGQALKDGWGHRGVRPPYRNVCDDDARELGTSVRVVGMVRNPFARLVSAYHRPGFVTPWESFVARVCDYDDDEIDPHLRSQVACLPDHAEMFRIEDEDSWGRYCRVLEDCIGRYPEGLGVHNQTEHEPWPTFYTDETAEAVRVRYAADFERFGYSTGIP